ncbi:MAG: DUF1573 domain-containing protein [Flavobacteriales bacterium]|nr:DUF1573 domain-containing protein [Flavobacteriales bacterium]
MKKVLFWVFISGLVACGSKDSVNTDLVNNPATASGEVKNGNLPEFEFESTEFDFGTIVEGQKVKHVFKFKNVGKADLVISDAKGSCGCTIPQYPEKPIPPGGKGEIEVEFNSSKKQGDQNKTVTLYANTSPTEFVLRVKGFVKEG